jgi:hypothetical protein
VNANCGSDTFTPRYSLLTNGNILGADGNTHALPGGQGNTVGVDPGFVTPFVNQLAVAGSRLDPQRAAVTITGQDPPVGIFGDYHIPTTTGAGSQVVDRGVRCSNTPFPAPTSALNPCTGGGIEAPLGTPSATNPGGGDYDSQSRPQLRTIRIRTPWDRGADELPGVPIPLTLSQIQSATSTARALAARPANLPYRVTLKRVIPNRKQRERLLGKAVHKPLSRR